MIDLAHIQRTHPSSKNLKMQTWRRMSEQENKIVIHQIGDDDELILNHTTLPREK